MNKIVQSLILCSLSGKVMIQLCRYRGVKTTKHSGFENYATTEQHLFDLCKRNKPQVLTTMKPMKLSPRFFLCDSHPPTKVSRRIPLFLLLLALPLSVFGQANYATPYTFTTLAGSAGIFGSADGTGSAAQFGNPYSVAVDTIGNVYVADTINSTIRKVTPAGVVTTFAGLAGVGGSANGTGSVARFNDPYGVAVDVNGNVYVADTYNSTIRKVTPAGVVTTLAGLAGTSGSANGTGSAARFNNPYGVAVDTNGNVYVADTYNFTIRKVTPAGVVTTLAGVAESSGSANGTGSAARFYYPDGVAVGGTGNLYVADGANDEIRKGFFAPFVQVTANPTNGVPPLTVQFTAGSMDSSGHAITNWNWAFGDGSTSALQNSSHTYNAAGNFYPSLAATNNLGGAVGGTIPSITVSSPTV
jgi:PKD repeat protein